jgi:hypothetical protein
VSLKNMVPTTVGGMLETTVESQLSTVENEGSSEQVEWSRSISGRKLVRLSWIWGRHP